MEKWNKRKFIQNLQTATSNAKVVKNPSGCGIGVFSGCEALVQSPDFKRSLGFTHTKHQQIQNRADQTGPREAKHKADLRTQVQRSEALNNPTRSEIQIPGLLGGASYYSSFLSSQSSEYLSLVQPNESITSFCCICINWPISNTGNTIQTEPFK